MDWLQSNIISYYNQVDIETLLVERTWIARLTVDGRTSLQLYGGTVAGAKSAATDDIHACQSHWPWARVVACPKIRCFELPSKYFSGGAGTRLWIFSWLDANVFNSLKTRHDVRERILSLRTHLSLPFA